MAMALNNDGGVNAGLGTLNKNIAKVGADLRKIASGQRINGAGDAASEFAIGKKMRVLTRALGQDIENSQKGIDLVNVAERGINSIVDELRNLKRMALDSANDHNTDVDRATIQKEFSSRMAEIDDIAATTNYNGIYLLDGRWYRSSGGYNTEKVTETVTTYETVTEPYTETVTTYEEIEEEYPYTYTKTTEKPLESHAVRPPAATPTGVSEPGVFYVGGNPVQATKVITATTNYTIAYDGAYMIPENYTGDLHITAKNVKLVRQNNAKPLYDVFIDTSSSGNTNLWLENLDLRYRVKSFPTDSDGKWLPYVFDQSFIKFQGNNNVLTIKGNNKITIGESDIGMEGMVAYEKAFINVGDGLTIEGVGTLEFKEGKLPNGWIIGALIGSDQNETSTANITINSGNIITSSEYENPDDGKLIPYGKLTGAVIGSGENGTIGNIAINGGTFDLLVSGGGACIGGGQCSVTGNITVQDATIKARCDDGACIGSGDASNNYSSTGYIYILNSNLDLQNTEIAHSGWENPSGTGAAIGGGGTYNGANTYVGDITVENSTIKAITDRGAGIGTGGDSEVGGTGAPHAYGISIINSTLDITVNDSRAEKIGKGVNGIIPVDTVEEEVTEIRTRTVKIPHEETVTGERTYQIPHENTYEREYNVYYQDIDNPLVIHTGPKANQRLYIYIKCMKSEAMGLNGAGVETREKALKSLDKLDEALEYALNEATQMGAYQMRLNQTVETLTARHENTIAADSVITDADMAKEMTSYMKHNILAQSSQAMLAQANQKRESILSLLA